MICYLPAYTLVTLHRLRGNYGVWFGRQGDEKEVKNGVVGDQQGSNVDLTPFLFIVLQALTDEDGTLNLLEEVLIDCRFFYYH